MILGLTNDERCLIQSACEETLEFGKKYMTIFFFKNAHLNCEKLITDVKVV